MPLDGNEPNRPPRRDEIEISIFGPGYGECIAAHVGEGDWIIVDSCLSADSREPLALEYLDGLGVDVSAAVKRVIATHWHDDHIGGMGSVFKEASSAEFWCSTALSSKEWLVLVELQRANYTPTGPGVREMRSIMDELRRRAASNEVASPKFALEGLPVFSRTGDVTASVIAYAPSHAAVLSMHGEFAKLLEQAKRRLGMVPSMGPNDGSVVLSIRVGEASVLLGADLEERGKTGLGWTAVLAYAGNPDVQHEGFKVPHHGSPTGHHPDVWPRMMKGEAWAAVTPWRRGSGLPTKDDARRIISESKGHAYLTAPLKPSKYRHPDPAVKRTFLEMGVKLQKDIGKQGHIRLRRVASTAGPWSIELFRDACKLSDMLEAEAA